MNSLMFELRSANVPNVTLKSLCFQKITQNISMEKVVFLFQCYNMRNPLQFFETIIE